MIFPELWKEYCNCVKILIRLQETVIKRLPAIKLHLLNGSTNHDDCQTQVTLCHYLLLRSLYTFAGIVTKTITKWCNDLEKSHNELEIDEENARKNDLTLCIHELKQMPLFELIDDPVCGLLRLDELKERLSRQMNFTNVIDNWSFRDIMGNIKCYGLTYESLWQSALHSTDPTEVNISELM